MPRKVTRSCARAKIGLIVLFVLLFLLIINQFFRENRLLLEERNNWRDKAALFAERLDRLEAEEKLSAAGKGDAGRRELSLQGLEVVTLTLLPEDQVNYTFSVIIKNRSTRRIQPDGGVLFLFTLAPGGEISGTDWQNVKLPFLAAGEVKELLVSGELIVKDGEELIAYFDLPGYAAGPLKAQTSLLNTPGLALFAPGR